MSKKLTAEQINKFLQGCKDTIKVYGHILQYVGAGEGEPAYTYTAGFANSNLPDFIVFGAVNCHLVIDEVVQDKLVLDTALVSEILQCKLTDGTYTESRYMVKEIDLESFSKYAMGAFNLNMVEKRPVKAYQIYLGDKNNILPGEPDYLDYGCPQLWL